MINLVNGQKININGPKCKQKDDMKQKYSWSKYKQTEY